MSKTISTNKSSTKKIVKIILIIPLALIGLIVIYVGAVFVTKPIFDRLDHDKFSKLDTQMQTIFGSLKSEANGADNWDYSTYCDSEMSGDFPTGRYVCTALISMEKTVTSAQEVSDLQTKYYPIIDGSNTLKQKTALDLELPGDFGKKFVVSGAEKNYIEERSGITCNYLLKLVQLDVSWKSNDNSYGSKLYGESGNARINLTCTETARDYWYKISNPALLADPNAPLIKQ